MFAKSNIIRTFVIVRSSLGVSDGLVKYRLFLLAYTIQRWFVFVPEAGDPETGSDSGNGHRFYFGLLSKNVS